MQAVRQTYRHADHNISHPSWRQSSYILKLNQFTGLKLKPI